MAKGHKSFTSKQDAYFAGGMIGSIAGFGVGLRVTGSVEGGAVGFIAGVMSPAILKGFSILYYRALKREDNDAKKLVKES